MSEKKESAVAIAKSIANTETEKKAPVSGRASGYSAKAVKLYKASKMRFLASQKKK